MDIIMENREKRLVELEALAEKHTETVKSLESEIQARLSKIDTLKLQQSGIEDKLNSLRDDLNLLVMKQGEAQKRYEVVLPIVNSFPSKNAELTEKLDKLSEDIIANQKILEANQKQVEEMYKNPHRIEYYIKGLQVATNKKGKIDVAEEMKFLNM